MLTIIIYLINLLAKIFKLLHIFSYNKHIGYINPLRTNPLPFKIKPKNFYLLTSLMP